MEKLKKIFTSPVSDNLLLKLVILVGLLIIVILIFLAGEEVGYRRAEFSSQFSDNYTKIFGGRPMGDGGVGNSHGASGTIVKISLPEVFIESPDGSEKVITINNTSIIKELRNTVASTTLKVGDEVIVLGEPGPQGDVQAGLIRVIPGQTPATQN